MVVIKVQISRRLSSQNSHHVHILHGNPPKSHNKRVKCEWNFIYLPNKVSVSLLKISLTHVVQYIFVDVSCTEQYSNRKKSVQ